MLKNTLLQTKCSRKNGQWHWVRFMTPKTSRFSPHLFCFSFCSKKPSEFLLWTYSEKSSFNGYICLTSLNNNKFHVPAQCIVIQQHWLDTEQLHDTGWFPTSFCDQIYSVCKAFTFLYNLPAFEPTSGNSGFLSCC